MNYSFALLGRYAILQHDISTQRAERHQTQSDKRTFFARFARWRPIANGAVNSESRMSPATETEKLTSLAEGSHYNLFVAKTVFPFVLFADTIKIDRQKLTIVHNGFLWKSQTASTEIKNIMNIKADVGPLFGSITVTSKHFLNNTQTIKYLKRSDVATVQRLLQGFMIAQRAKINTDDIDQDQLLKLLNELGQENRK
ncbi:MAG TPA: hypothetical protein VLE73_03650 [Candidatus Saccharimonadales bacterium]|nr:hypothetical protein [Candidatus Saccharimonadales bacterium]